MSGLLDPYDCAALARLREVYGAGLRYRQPTTVQFCTRCVLSNQRPRLQLDAEGVCNACRVAEAQQAVDWELRRAQFRRLLDRYRRADGQHDVLVPFSGGKDSSMVAHRLKYEYGMHPLTVTFPALLLTDLGDKNWHAVLETLQDSPSHMVNRLASPAPQVYRALARCALEVMGDPFLPFIYGVKAFPAHVALEYGIPLIVYAEDGEAVYGGGRTQARFSHNLADDLDREYFSGLPPAVWAACGFSPEQLAPFLPPPMSVLLQQQIQCVFFGSFHPWIPQENYYYVVEHCGWQPNPQRSEGTYSKYASLDDKLDGLHYYLSYLKFGLGRASSDAAHEIRDGHITREEGVALVRRFDGEFPAAHLNACLHYLDLDWPQLCVLLLGWMPSHLWKAGTTTGWNPYALRHTVS